MYQQCLVVVLGAVAASDNFKGFRNGSSSSSWLPVPWQSLDRWPRDRQGMTVMCVVLHILVYKSVESSRASLYLLLCVYVVMIY